MTRKRTLAVAGAGALLLILLLLLAVPLALRGPVERKLKQTATNALAARVDWRRAQLGLLRDFPNLSLRLHDLSIVGVDRFAGDTLLALPRLAVSVDLTSVLANLRGRGPLEVRAVAVHLPRVRLLVLEDGVANWRISRPGDAPARSSRALDLHLEKLTIDRGRVTLENRQSGLYTHVLGLKHTLSGDFRQQQFSLRTSTAADSVAVRFAGVNYLSDVSLAVDAALAADLAQQRFTVRENRVRINDLELSAQGSAALQGDDIALDLAFSAPRADFKQVLSLVPAVYTREFASVQTSGTAAVKGYVRGRYGKRAFPAFGIDATVANAMFRYPDLPLPARDIALQLSLTNPGGSADSSVLDVQRFHVVLGDDAVDGSLVLRTPVSDPDVAFRVAGLIDLGALPRTVKLPDVQELRGELRANAGMRARLSDVQQKRFERVSADGTLELRRLALAAKQLRQPLAIEEAVLRFTPRQAELSSFRGRAGSSDVRMTGSLENVLGFVLRREELRGQVKLASARLDLNEWRSNDALKAIAVPGMLDFALDATADTVRFGTLALHGARGALHVKGRRATLSDFSMRALGGELSVSGWYETLDPGKPAFSLKLGLGDVDVPAAFAGLRTIQAFAPVARYAEGRASAQLELSGSLGEDMLPDFARLTGLGSLVTSGLVLRDFPALDGLARLLALDLLQDPGFKDLKSSFAIRDGRLQVRPFTVQTGDLAFTVSGSNGIDQSLDYDVALALPRAALGTATNRAVTSIVNRSARAGLDLSAAEVITLGVKVGGTVTSPALTTSFRDAAGGTAQAVAQSLRNEAERRAQLMQARADSAAAATREQARAEAERLVAEAEQRANALRAEARTLAEKLRAEAGARIDSLTAKASSPAARIAARAAADRLRREADNRANALVREADMRADSLVLSARRRAGLPEIQ